MINEAYALDIGRKIRAQQRQAMKDGKFIGARTPYGYLKAEDDCHQLIIDPVAAVVVQRMFRWASEGAGLNTIAVRLNEEGVLTPSHYKKMQGKITHENLLGSGKWQTRTVGVILRSEVYTGDLVQGQTKTVDYRQVKADAEEWTVVRDTHEAIISREQFAAVQEILNQTASRAKAREVKAYCGHALSHTMQKTSYYYCRHSEADVESRCHKMRLNAAELEQTVFLTLKKQMEAAAPLAPDGTLRVDASVPERAEYEQQIETLQDGKRTLYERYLMGEIDLNTYKAEKAACDELLLKTKNAYAVVLAQAKQKQDEQARQDSRKEASKAIFDADALTTELAELLIDRVLVYPDKRIEIAYKIQDIFA